MRYTAKEKVSLKHWDVTRNSQLGVLLAVALLFVNRVFSLN